MLYGLPILFIIAFLLLRWGSIAVGVHMLKHPPRRTAGTMIANGYPCDPEEAGYAYETLDWWDEALEIKREVWVAQGEQQDGPVIIMVHGWGDSKYGMLHWLPYVAKVADKVMMFDLRGHGDCKYDNFMWGMDEIEDLHQVLKMARDRYPDNKRVVMGFSMGAAVAINMAYHDAKLNLIDAMILESPYRNAEDVIINTIKLRNLPQFIGKGASRKIHLNVIGRNASGKVKISKCDSDRMYHKLSQDIFDFLKKTTIPTLILHGDADVITPLSDIKRGAETMNHVRLEVFENSGHLQAACAHPERFVKTISDFTQTIP